MSVPLWGEPPTPDDYVTPLGWGVTPAPWELAASPPSREVRQQPQGTAVSFAASPFTLARRSHFPVSDHPVSTSGPATSASGWSMRRPGEQLAPQETEFTCGRVMPTVRSRGYHEV